MSVERLDADARRWFHQAKDDLEAAEVLVSARKHAQASFLAQQAGEKALKAVWIRLDLDPWGHSLGRLIRDLPAPRKEQLANLLDTALALDKLYIPTRYPDSLADQTPAEAYTMPEARAAVEHAHTILDAAMQTLEEIRKQSAPQ